MWPLQYWVIYSSAGQQLWLVALSCFTQWVVVSAEISLCATYIQLLVPNGSAHCGKYWVGSCHHRHHCCVSSFLSLFLPLPIAPVTICHVIAQTCWLEVSLFRFFTEADLVAEIIMLAELHLNERGQGGVSLQKMISQQIWLKKRAVVEI